jgi:cbb3-type cytochrome oxidase maturation protein
MKIMLLLILISLLLAVGFLLVYLWAARSGQFDDDFTPSVRMLFEDNPANLPLSSPDDVEGAAETEQQKTTANAPQ